MSSNPKQGSCEKSLDNDMINFEKNLIFFVLLIKQSILPNFHHWNHSKSKGQLEGSYQPLLLLAG